MKMKLMETRLLPRIAGALVAVLALGLFTANSQEAGPDQLRQEALELSRKAQDLKADGHQDEARQAMKEAEELRAKADRMARPDRPEARRDQELRARVADLQARLKELRSAGNQQEAMEVQRELQKIRQEMSRPGREPGSRGPREMGRENRPERGPGGPPPPREELERRLQHLQVAIENLHAAGLDEPAERLTQLAERMRRQLAERPMGEEGPPPVMAELDQLRREVRELQDAVRSLNQRVEQLSRDR